MDWTMGGVYKRYGTGSARFLIPGPPPAQMADVDVFGAFTFTPDDLDLLRNHIAHGPAGVPKSTVLRELLAASYLTNELYAITPADKIVSHDSIDDLRDVYFRRESAVRVREQLERTTARQYRVDPVMVSTFLRGTRGPRGAGLLYLLVDELQSGSPGL